VERVLIAGDGGDGERLVVVVAAGVAGRHGEEGWERGGGARTTSPLSRPFRGACPGRSFLSQSAAPMPDALLAREIALDRLLQIEEGGAYAGLAGGSET